jgi:cellulose synthase/poly-beta-1,6-N-acetylglucosamine synthase-like glycosyltransferase
MIITYFLLVLFIISIAITVPVCALLLEVMFYVIAPDVLSIDPPFNTVRNRIGVLIPAHNEETIISIAISSILPQLFSHDLLLVVADNCSDNTAIIAKSLGAEVVVRTNLDQRGKGFALDWGIRHFAQAPPEIVVVVDADCKLGDLAIDRLASLCAATNRPVQALDIMVATANSTIASRGREFAWRVRNWIRPRGLNLVGLPCQLMGTGMAFPWEIIASARLASGSLVEDLKLGLELTAAGHAPVFCPTATVTSDFPTTREGAQNQQLRWEQGHLGMIVTELPRMLIKSAFSGNFNLFCLTIDAAVPPLSLLMNIVLIVFIISIGVRLLGIRSATLSINEINTVGFGMAMALCWWKSGRDLIPINSIPEILFISLKKIGFYYVILSRRARSAWVRTERDKI